jgi:acyl-CoA synthetase (AMP-forming)/AMP-acid ligase II
MNVSKTLSGLAASIPEKTALIFKTREFTYKHLNTSANSIAGYLMEKGIRTGDNVAVILPNCPEFAFIYFASAKVGTIFTPIDTRLGEAEIISILHDTNAKICFIHPDLPFGNNLSRASMIVDVTGEEFISHSGNHPENKDYSREINPGDTALYLHTSGTTGRPKIVELTCSNLDCFPDAMQDCVVLKEKEVLGIILPMSHISGPIILNLLLTQKCRLVIIDSINPLSLFENLAKHKITYFHAVPPVFSLMLKSGFAERYDTSSLDLIAMMGTSVPVSLMNAFKKAFPHVVVLQGYGLTETSPLITLTRREDADQKRASIGTPVEGAEVVVVDEEDNPLGAGEIGQLIVKGPMVMKGYLNAPYQNSERIRNGFFYTNDLVKYDADNYFYHMGRRDDMVVLANGQNVYPAEIQNIIFSHPAVLDSEVIGNYSEKEKGNILHAFVVPAPDFALNEGEIRSMCTEHLGSIKTPKKVTLMEALPKTATGKTNIPELKKMVEPDVA